jgi:hypothetical protein
MWVQKAGAVFIQFKAYGRLGRNVVTKFRIFRDSVKAFLLYRCETCKVTKRPTRVQQTFVNRRLTKIFQVFRPNFISNEELWRRKRKKISGSATEEMEVNRTCTDEEPLFLKQILSWNPKGRQSRSRRRKIEQKNLGRGQTKSLRFRWPCFVEVPCSEIEYKEMTCVTSDCRRGVTEAVTGSQRPYRCPYNSLCHCVPKSPALFLDPLTIVDETDKLSRNVR